MDFDRDKSKKQLITELESLRQENAELKNFESKQTERLPTEKEVEQKSWINFLSSRILIDSMQEIIAIKDLNGVHRASSSAMCDLIGKPESSVLSG
mgnify:CR=1 FL=1